MVKGDLDVKSKNLLKEATGHKVDNILDLAEFVSTMGSAKAASKMSSKALAEAQSKLGKALTKALNKAREIETVVSEKARLLNRAARQFIRRECDVFRGPKRVAKPVDFGRLFKKHVVKPDSKAEVIESISLNSELNFSIKALEHMSEVDRSVPVQILKDAIKYGKSLPDPRGSSATMYYTTMTRNGKMYNLEVLYDAKSNTIYHFEYARKAMGPLPQIK